MIFVCVILIEILHLIKSNRLNQQNGERFSSDEKMRNEHDLSIFHQTIQANHSCED